MEQLRTELKNFRSSAISLIFPSIFITIFSIVWVTAAIATGEIVMVFAGIIPVGLFFAFVCTMIYNFVMYARYKKVVAMGTKTTVDVVARCKGIQSGLGRVFRLQIEYDYNGERVKKWTPRIYNDWESSAILSKGKVEAIQYQKHILLSEPVKDPTDNEYYGDEYDREYNPHLYPQHEPEASGNSAFATQKAKAKPAAHKHAGAEWLCALADSGNQDAIAVQKQPTSYQRLRYCALNNVDEEVIEALKESLEAPSEALRMKQQMEWYRGLRSEITQPLEDSIRILDFLTPMLERPEMEDLMRCIILESEKTEQFMLPSAVVRRLKDYRSSL